MAFVHKIYVNYIDVSSGRSYELPALLTEKGILVSHVKYLAHFSYKSRSWQERSCYALRLLLSYINATPEILSATKTLKSFTESLLIGTIDRNLNDPLQLYWRTRRPTDVNNLLFHITTYTDFIEFTNPEGSSKINPFRKATSYEERLNWCAYYHKQANVFLNHLTKKPETEQYLKKTRVISRYKESVIDYEYATRFPEKYLEKLLYEGFTRNGIIDYKSIAITMLMNYGGLRKSEIFHIYTSDITLNPNHKKEALVRIYHPEEGESPDRALKNRREYLTTNTNYVPRNLYLHTKRLYAGWKDPVLNSKRGYFEVIFNPPQKAEEFLSIWVLYLKHQRVEPSKNNQHPFAFTNTKGDPETIKNFQRQYRNAVERIGLACSLSEGTSEHGHRHAYGFRLSESGLNNFEIQKAMHHKNPLSCVVYTKPTQDEIRQKLRDAE
ncbi:gamma-mobile-trio recombinase GmtY [Pseudomonas sp. FME51]|uniref:gamma-mobile-trio recombinase GmtY n=1 Tax=Pseudomonas sp. FME51 TaxID=2742609 RepID=UPI00186797B7|nr:gamma-mobile-trio recombinase GmtY [Pseudomonas sp. FME51]